MSLKTKGFRNSRLDTNQCPTTKGSLRIVFPLMYVFYVTFPTIKFANNTNFNNRQTEIKDEIMVLLPEVILLLSFVFLPRINQIKAK